MFQFATVILFFKPHSLLCVWDFEWNPPLPFELFISTLKWSFICVILISLPYMTFQRAATTLLKAKNSVYLPILFLFIWYFAMLLSPFLRTKANVNINTISYIISILSLNFCGLFFKRLLFCGCLCYSFFLSLCYFVWCIIFSRLFIIAIWRYRFCVLWKFTWKNIISGLLHSLCVQWNIEMLSLFWEITNLHFDLAFEEHLNQNNSKCYSLWANGRI